MRCLAQLLAEPSAADAARQLARRLARSRDPAGTGIGTTTIGATDSVGIARGAAGLIACRTGTAAEKRMARWISNRKKVVMHRTIPILASLAVIVVLASSAQAQTAATDRYCLQGRRWGFPGNCQFATHEQCRVNC